MVIYADEIKRARFAKDIKVNLLDQIRIYPAAAIKERILAHENDQK